MSYSLLVVDDEALTVRTISRGLREEGFEAFTANSGEEALKLFQEEKPDLILLDIVLPGIDGVEVLRRIKLANPAAIVVMMSAYHMVDRAVEAMKLGAYDYLIKGRYFEPTGKVSRARLGKLVDALKSLGDVPQDFAVERLFLPGITQVSD